MNLNRYVLIYSILFIFISCSDDTDGGGTNPVPVNPLDTQGNLLNGTWKVKDSNSVTKDGTIVDVFTSMTLTVSGGSASGGSYSTLNSDSDEIWPSSGSWTFQNADKNKILRSDGVAVSISVTEGTLRTSFTTTGGIKDGNWVFDFTKQ
ncbi:MAG: hypothetical protein VXY09_00070 [Bacteroidota bacterium]|nr:hypothetical protein [Bacteroidota bacterium]